MQFDWKSVEAELLGLLGDLPELSVDRERIERFSQAIASNQLSAESNRLSRDPEPAGPDDVDVMEEFSAAERDRYAEIGREALREGRVAAAVLNGGMATRFGGVVKGTVEAVGGRSFIEIKRAEAVKHGPVPFLAMDSFATHKQTLRFFQEHGLVDNVHAFLQAVSLRLTPDGELFRDGSGALSLYAPGHGDFPEALRGSGLLKSLREDGVQALLLSNVDNLGAGLDPEVIGYHLAHGKPLTVELAKTLPGDVGGSPARVGGRMQVVEGFRFPSGFDFSRLSYLNTNTFTISLDALEEDWPLTWFYVEKTVDDRKAIQMERLVGELSAFVDSAYLVAPREGSLARFFPVKTPEDLEGLRRDPVLSERFTNV